MISPILNALKILAIQLFFATNFFLAAWLKWSQGVPGWFTKQFEPTWLARAPVGLSGRLLLARPVRNGCLARFRRKHAAAEFLFPFAVVLVFVFGPGKLSLDALIAKYFKRTPDKAS